MNVISVAARMASNRLPGKVMADVWGRPLLAWQIDRLRLCKRAELVLTVPADPINDPIRALAAEQGVRVIEQIEGEMIASHARVMEQTGAGRMVLAGADDPFLEPEMIDSLVDALDGCDYAETAGWPFGMNGWAWTRWAMLEAASDDASLDERRHVRPYFLRRPHHFSTRMVRRPGFDLYNALRLTVDTEGDLELVRRLYRELRYVPAFGLADILALLLQHPDWLDLNRDELTGEAARAAIYDLTPVRVEAVA